MIFDTIIIGAGAAGLTAALYAYRYNLKTLIISRDIGGTALEAHSIENFPGYKKITGIKLMKSWADHIKSLKIEIQQEDIINIEKQDNIFTVTTKNNKKFQSKTVILALGMKRKRLNIEGEDKFLGKGVSYCATCLPPNESIIVNSSIKEIKDINPLTKVLTIDGTYKEISGFTKRLYKGKLISIRPRFFNEPTLLTPNHPVYSLEVKRDYYNKSLNFSKPTWLPAGALTKNHCVLYPILKELKDINEIKLSDFIEVKKEDKMILPFIETHTSNKIKDKIKIDNNFMRLVGYYISEGTVNKHMLAFYFRKDEDLYINDVKKILKEKFGLESKIKYEKNVCIIAIYSKIIADFFKSQFGIYSYKKSIPHWIILLPPKKQKELIKGLWRGDGCIRHKDFCYVTCSRELTYQIRDILLRLGIISSIQIRKKEHLNRLINRIEGRLVEFNHDKYHINVGGQFLSKMSSILNVNHPIIKSRTKICNHAWLNSKFAILPIRDINKIDYEGQVLNIAVPNNETYVAKNFIVHNCDGPLFKDKIVAVIGGGDTAFMDAEFLVGYAKKVYIIHRRHKFRTEPKREEQIKKNNKIEIIHSANIKEIKGTNFVKSIVLDNKTELKVDCVFIDVGFVPSIDIIKKLNVKCDEHDYIVVNNKQETNIPGLFAAGDITFNPLKQIIHFQLLSF